MKSYIFILLSIIVTSACKNDTADKPQVHQTDSVPEKQDDNRPDSIEDTLNLQDTLVPEPPKTVHKVRPESSKVEAVDLDKRITDPFEDPDYIGTPCGDYVNGKCTRHRHNYDKFDEGPEIKLPLDTLN